MKILNAVLSVFLLFTLFFFLVSCSGSSCCKGNTKTDIPQDIIEKGNQFIISKTGEDFFKKYVQPDLLISRELSPGYFLAYSFNIPEKPHVKGTIRFTVDSLGIILTDREISGIPDCMTSTGECDFNIDEEMAIGIAKQNSLEPGIKEWKRNFIWNAQFDKYVWQILNTHNESEGGYGKRANGREMIIDAGTGELLAINEWRVN